MFKAVLLFSILGLLHPQVETRHVREGHWRIDRSQDKFTGAVTCSTSLGALRIEGPALVVDFGPHVDTALAVYRLDTGPAIPADTETFNAQYHARIVGEAPIDNPSAGRIAIRVSELADARALWVRTSSRAAPRRFDIGDLQRVKSAEAALGCP